MREIFSCDDVMMSAFLEAESQQQILKRHQLIVGKGQDEAVADSKKKSRPKSDFNLGKAGIPITGAFWTKNLDKVFFYGQEEFMADAVDAPCDVSNAVLFKGVSLTFEQMQEWACIRSYQLVRSDAITIVIVIAQVIVWSGAEVAVTVWKMAVRVHIETVQPAIQQVHHEIPWRSRVKHSTMMLWAEKVQEVRRSVARSNGFDRKRWPRRWDLERADERISQSRW